MKIVTSQEKIEDYFNSDRVNQSLLKDLGDGLQPYLDKKAKRENQIELPEQFAFGQAAETILQEGEEVFKQKFFISSMGDLPSDTEIEIIKEVYDKAKDLYELQGVPVVEELKVYGENLANAIINKKYYSNRKTETNVNNLIEKCSNYFKELVLSEGKTILSLESKTRVDKTVKNLLESPNTKRFFSNEFNDSPNTHIFFQLPLYFNYLGVDCKTLLDIVIVEVDENNNALSIEPVDLKTMAGYTLKFPASAKKYRYDIQAAFYSLAFTADDLIVPEGFPVITENTEIKSFKFVVESSTNQKSPLVFVVDDSIISSGLFGERADSGRWYKYGINYLVKYYRYLRDNNWESERVIDENNGILTLTSEGIKELFYD